ncbi:hypothetical protein ACF0H5_018298 [Mactra antiquata]
MSPILKVHNEDRSQHGISYHWFESTSNGNLNPFLPVFVKQLGLSSTETGIIFGLLPFIAFLICPLIGALADKARKHILTLTICILLSGILHCLLLLVPSKTCEVQSDSNHNVELEQHFKNSLEFLNCTINSPQSYQHLISNSPSCESLVDAILADNGHINISECQGRCNEWMDAQQNLTNLRQPVGLSKLSEWRVCLDEDNNCNIQLSNPNDGVHQVHAAYNVLSSNIVALDNLTEIIDTYVCQQLCDNPNATSSGRCTIRDSYDRTFWLTLLIFLFCSIAVSPVSSLMDALAYATLGNRRNEWGKQRLFGTLGCGLLAVTSSFAMDAMSKSGTGINYSISFYIYMALGIMTCIIVHFLDVSEDVQCSHMLKNIKFVLKYPKIVIFLIVILCLGILNSVVQTFLFWYLQELGSTQSVLGLSILAQCIPEMIAFFGSGYVIEHIGHTTCLYLALLGYAVRFFSYSYLMNAWYVLLIEPFHSVTFGLMFSASTSYCSIIAPDGMSATIQGLLGGLYYGFGKGIGNIVTGKLYDRSSGLGPVWTFRFYGFLSLVICGVCMLANICMMRFGNEHSSTINKSEDKEENNVVTGELLLKPVIESNHAQ